MSLAVLVAVTDRAAEAALVAAFARPDLRVTVARRCVDLTDLLAAAGGGLGQVALVSDGLPRLDREALTKLGAAELAVVGLFADAAGEGRLRELGVATLLPLATEPVEVAAALAAVRHAPAPDTRALGATSAAGNGHLPRGAALAGSDQAGSGAMARPPESAAPPNGAGAPELAGAAGVPGLSGAAGVAGLSGIAGPTADAGLGQVIAVWGPPGAPGRSMLATGLACELAILGVPALLVDADVYAPSVAQLLGLLEESAGLAGAVRAANLGTLSAPALAGHARQVRLPGPAGAPAELRVLTGLSRPSRWPELRPAALTRTLELARLLVPVTIVDVSACLESDEELSYDVAVPRRNGATLAILQDADQVLAVGAADPVGLARLVRGLSDLGEAVPGCSPAVVVNRLRRGPVPGDAAAEVRAALQRFAGVRPRALLPEDRAAADAALAAGRCLAEVAPGSPLRLHIRTLAAQLCGQPVPEARRRRPRVPARRGAARGTGSRLGAGSVGVGRTVKG